MPLKSSFVGQVVQSIILAEKARHNQNSVKITFFAPKVQKNKKNLCGLKIKY